jgi:SAM-dependent methyltransferase
MGPGRVQGNRADDARWLRGDGAVAFARAGSLTIVGADGVVRRCEGDVAEVVRAALAAFAEPKTRDELLATLRALGGECPPEIADQAIALLAGAGAIQSVDSTRDAAPRAVGRRGNVVLCVTGAIAAVEAPQLAGALLARGFDVRVAMTAAGRRFVSETSLAAITHQPVVTSLWQAVDGGSAAHVQLAGWADLVVVHPATATTIARIAQGLCTDVVSATVAATRAPVLVVPSMNRAMLDSPAVARNLDQLRDDGRYVVEPTAGLEVASVPSARTPMLGAAPRASSIAACVELLAREHGVAIDWDAEWARGAPDRLPWFTADVDADLAALIEASPRGRLIDVGTGLGQVARFAAERGFSVVASDVSRRAIELARATSDGAAAASVRWLVDDVLDARLHATFDLAVDRGCFHVLAPSRRAAYVATLARWLAPGGRLLLKSHAPSEGARHRTYPLGADEVARVFAPAFSLESTRASRFDGTVDPAPAALLFTLIRRADDEAG